jgi:hypothetical protein
MAALPHAVASACLLVLHNHCTNPQPTRLCVCVVSPKHTGLELALQIKVAASSGAAACFLDALTAFLTLLIIWSISCDAEVDGGICNSLMNWAAVFGVYLTWHAYISMTVAARARALLPMLNPVSSGVVQL